MKPAIAIAISTFAAVALFSCGGLLPFGEDDEPPPREPDPNRADADPDARTADGSSIVVDDDASTDAANEQLPPGPCSGPTGTCTVLSDCCAGTICQAAKCCIPDGQKATFIEHCCSNTGALDPCADGLCCPSAI